MEKYDELVNEILNEVSLTLKINKVPIELDINSKKSVTMNRNGFTYVMINKSGVILENAFEKVDINYSEIKELKYGCAKIYRYGIRDQSARIFITTNAGEQVMIYRKVN